MWWDWFQMFIKFLYYIYIYIYAQHFIYIWTFYEFLLKKSLLFWQKCMLNHVVLELLGKIISLFFYTKPLPRHHFPICLSYLCSNGACLEICNYSNGASRSRWLSVSLLCSVVSSFTSWADSVCLLLGFQKRHVFVRIISYCGTLC